MKILMGCFLFILSFLSSAAELYCEWDEKTPKEFNVHIPRVSYVVTIVVEGGVVKDFSNESIKKVERHQLYYLIDFKNGGSAYLHRESLNLIYLNASMARDGLGAYYGNSRDAGADYKCRLLAKKI